MAPSVAIIGGSLVGPTAALLLRQAGYDDVTLYEATPAGINLAGGVIGLEHSALDVLDRINIPQDEVIPYTSERVISIRVADRREADYVRRIYPGRTTTWTLLHDALWRRLPAECVRSGARLRSITPCPQGGAQMAFDSGAAACADLIIFADGRRSAGRKILDPMRRLRYAGYVAHRGAPAFCPPDWFDFLRYEPAQGGTQFTAFPTQSGADWTFYLDATPAQFDEMFGAAPTQRMFCLPHHVSAQARAVVDAAAADMLPPLVAAMVRETRMRQAAPVVDIDPPTRMVWPIGDARAVLIGDALAPVRPHTARGANNGIEQADGLTAALRQVLRWGADLDGALEGWEKRYLPTARAAVEAGPAMAARLGLGVGR